MRTKKSTKPERRERSRKIRGRNRVTSKNKHVVRSVDPTTSKAAAVVVVFGERRMSLRLPWWQQQGWLSVPCVLSLACAQAVLLLHVFLVGIALMFASGSLLEGTAALCILVQQRHLWFLALSVASCSDIAKVPHTKPLSPSALKIGSTDWKIILKETT